MFVSSPPIGNFLGSESELLAQDAASAGVWNECFGQAELHCLLLLGFLLQRYCEGLAQTSVAAQHDLCMEGMQCK